MLPTVAGGSSGSPAAAMPRAIERMTGLEVTEVNIAVHDVHLDNESDDKDSDESTITRVQ